MANNKPVSNMVIRLGLDDTAFKNGLASAKSSTKYWMSEMKASLNVLDRASSQVDKLKVKQDGLTKIIETQRKEVEELTKRYKNSYDENGKASDKTADYAREVNNAVAKLSSLEKQLDGVNTQLKIHSSKVVDVGKKMERQATKINNFGEAFSKMGSKLTKAFTLPLVGAVGASVKAAADWESAFAGVKKTVDEVVDKNGKVVYSYAKIEKGLRDLAKETPNSVESLAELAESAGQLGIHTENVLGFTEVMSKLNVATDIAGEEGAQSIARFANVTKMSQKDFDRLGSTITYLGNNSAATENEILELSMRLAGAGAQVGMSQSDILALAASLKSVGIEAEAGGSAFTKVLSQMQLSVETNSEKLAEFANVAGVTSEEFANKFKNKPVEALDMFIKGLSNMDERGISAIKVLDDMGIKEARLRDNLLRSANASGTLTKYVKESSEAWQENTALTEEADVKYGTLKSQMDKFKNNIKDIGINLGAPFMAAVNDMVLATEPFVNKISELSKKFVELPKSTQQNIVKFTGLAMAMGPLLKITGGLFKSFASLHGGIGKIISRFGIAAVKTGGFAKSIGVVKGAVVALTTGPLGWLALGVGTVGTAFVVAYKKNDKFKKSVDSLASSAKNTIKELNPFAKAVKQTEIFGEGVSKATEKALGSYVELAQGASQSLNQITTDTNIVTDGMVEKYQQAGQAGVKAMEDSAKKQHEKLVWLFENNDALTDDAEQKALEKLDKNNEEKRIKLEENNARIQEILQNAKDERRQLNDNETAELKELEEERDKIVIGAVAKREAEQKVILERMKNNNIATSAEEATEIIKQANKAEKETTKAAAKKRDKIIAEAIYQRDTAGTINEEQAARIIKSAEKEYTSTTETARKTRTETVETVRLQNDEIEKNVDLKTGKVKTKWQQMTDSMKENTKDGTTKSGAGLKWIMDLIGNSFTIGAYPYAKGTPQGGHPGGLAVVGDGGKSELVIPKGGTPFLSPSTDTIVPLPKGSEVLSGEKTATLFKDMLPHFKKGTGGFLSNLIDKSKHAFSKVKDWSSSIFEWVTDKLKIKELLANKIGKREVKGFDFHKKLDDSIMSKTMDNMSDKIFEHASAMSVSDAGMDGNGVYSFLMNIARGLMSKYGMVFTSGYRAGDPYDHGKGLAVDIALPGVSGSPIYTKAANEAINMPGIKYVITNGMWKHKGKPWVPWPDGDHYDHVHISGEKPKGDAIAQLGGGGAVNRWSPVIQRAAALMGQSLSGGELNGILAQIQRESGGNDKIIQSSAVWDINTASGNPARGLLQYIPQTFRAYMVRGYENIMNGFHQLMAFFNNSNWKRDLPYGRSGWGPTGVRVKGYANGGIVDKHQLAQIAEGNKPEMVIPLTKKSRAVSLINKAKEIVGMNDGQVVVNNDYSSLENKLDKLIGIVYDLATADNTTVLNIDSRTVAKAIHKPVSEYQKRDKNRRALLWEDRA